MSEDATVSAKRYTPRPDPVIIYKKWCKACGICIELCPQKVFDADRDGYPVITHGLDCTQCSICWVHCPDFAIVSTEK